MAEKKEEKKELYFFKCNFTIDKANAFKLGDQILVSGNSYTLIEHLRKEEKQIDKRIFERALKFEVIESEKQKEKRLKALGL